MTEKLVGAVRPYEHKTGTWMVSVPKDVAEKLKLSDFSKEGKKEGEKISVFYDEQRNRVIYQL